MSQTPVVPVSGTRDFLPLDVVRREYVINIVKDTFRLYGFQPVETPVMERLATLQGKYGEEGDQLMYKVLKRGAKLTRALTPAATEDDLADMGLRYDLTVPLARLVAANTNTMLPVFKRYQIQPVYRAERPAKGRYREFMQCDVDIVGVNSVDAEADVINAGVTILRNLHFTRSDDFCIRLNHRQILQGLLALAGVPSAQSTLALVAIDKLDKIGPDGVRTDLAQRGLPPASVQCLMDIMADLAQVSTSAAMFLALRRLLSDQLAGQAGLQELETLTALLEAGPTRDTWRVDPFLARGMGYYTGPIYEIQFPDLASSGGGGGRYDDLLGYFAGSRIPACGFSLGLERIILIMEQRDLFPADLAAAPQVLIAQMDPAVSPYLHRIAHQLRTNGLHTDLFPAPGRLKRQFRYAEKQGIRYVLIAGEVEAAGAQVAVKDLTTGSQIDVALSDLPATLRQLLGIPSP